jgi:2-polyprenyl-3-methyl-5-hydroxy-6-metoxy-1,4-benzoquinol methylase
MKIKKFIPKNCVLCDIGCGFNASFLQDMSNYIHNGYGFDKKVNDKHFKNIVIKNFDIGDRIPLENESVDCVTLLAVLEHLENPKKILSESNRILKTGGSVLITTPSLKSKSLLEFLSFRLHIVSPAEIQDHKHYFSKTELITLLEEAGFHQVAVSEFECGLNNCATGYK